MPIEIIVTNTGKLKGWHWKYETQCGKNPFIHHSSLSEMRLSPEYCFIIPSEEAGVSPFTLFVTVPTTAEWTWLFALHNCPWDFIWIEFVWGDVWVTPMSDSALNLLDSFIIVPWWAVMCGTPDNTSFTSHRSGSRAYWKSGEELRYSEVATADLKPYTSFAPPCASMFCNPKA